MKKAVFLDRDGVIVHELPAYAHRLDDLHMIEGAAEAIRSLNDAGFLTIVVTNQAGIARGIFKEEDMHIFNRAIADRVKAAGGRLDAFYFCPHHPEAEVKEYRIVCSCRKPATGLLKKAASDLSVDLAASFLVGDKRSDIGAGKAVGCKTIMVKTGLGESELKKESQFEPDAVRADLKDAACWIIKTFPG